MFKTNRSLILSCLGILIFSVSTAQGRMCNVKEYGAVGDKRTNDGPAVQQAIEACVKGGGGTVYVPAGDYFCGGLRLKSNVRLYLEAGATVEQIAFTNCSIETMREPEVMKKGIWTASSPIFVDIEKRNKDSKVGAVRDLTFADIDIISDRGILIQGMRKQPIENLTLRNINFRVTRGFDYRERKKRIGGRTEQTEDRRHTEYARQPAYATLANIEGLTVDRLRVLIPEEVFSKYPRRALSLHNVDKALVSNVCREPAVYPWRAEMSPIRVEPVVNLENCRNSWVTKCLAQPGTEAFLQISGKETANISVRGNEFQQAKKGVDITDDVLKGAVRY